VSRCARCDWHSTPDIEETPRDQLAQHADAASHPLCVVCGHSLGWDETQTCETPRHGRPGQPDISSCLQRARELLSGIITLYFDDLPTHLGHVRGSALDGDRPGASDGRPLPGGDVLVLLAGGSEGLAEDGETTRDGDMESVAFSLGYWERTWAAARGEQVRVSHRPKVQVRQAAGYLERHARWAARNHPGFADYAADLRLIHERLERATGRHQRLIRAEAECFGCGADALVREITDAGFDDRWTCRRCGEKYDWERYLLAVSGRLQESDVPGWGLPEQVAYVLGANPKTVRGWCNRGKVATACAVQDKPSPDQLAAGRKAPMRVWWDEARRRAEKLPAKVRKAS
jgi:hypothetical protein